jgi:V/A-type H+-transporting ATPase subunit C
VREEMSVSNYANVYARIRARVGDIIDEGGLRELVDARPGDFLSLLMDTAYKEKITKAGLATVDARGIENALKEELVDQYQMVLRSTKGATRDIFEEILRRLEVKNLKAIIRAKAAAARTRGPEDILIFPVEDIFKRRISTLKEYNSLDEVLSHVESPYRDALESVLPEFEETDRLFVLEKALDEELCGAILGKTDKLRGDDKEIVKKIVGSELDFVNLMTVLRCKAEGIAEEELRGYLLPYSYAVDFSATALNDSVSAENVTAAIRAMPTSDYKNVLTRTLPLYESEETLIPFENALWRYFFVTVKKTLKGYPINIGTIIGFLYLKELEIQNLCTIAVCKENELPPKEIAKLVLSA